MEAVREELISQITKQKFFSYICFEKYLYWVMYLNQTLFAVSVAKYNGDTIKRHVTKVLSSVGKEDANNS